MARPISRERREPPPGWSAPFKKYPCDQAGHEADTPPLPPRQEIERLNSVNSFLTHWREGIQGRIELSQQGDQPISELYELPREVAALKRAICAFRDWRAS